MPVTTLTAEYGGRTLTIETGRLARLAGGSVTIRYGDTLLLGTANRSEPRPGLDFFPLTVDFEERMYAAGKIPGGFIKRESRPSEAAILAARLTDRPIRPLFPEGYKDDVQIVLTVLSTDRENDPDILGTIAASAALTISEIPFQGPVGAVRVGRIDGQFVINPTFPQLAESELDLVVSGTRDAIMMVEAGAKLLTEDVMAEAILFGHRSLQPIIDLQEQLRAQVGKKKRIPFIEPATDSVIDFVDAVAADKPFVVFDLETTSWDVKLGQIVEIGAVKVQGGKVTDRWSTLVKPSRPIVGAQLHGITQKDVEKAPSVDKAVADFLEFAGDALVVGHNVGFDLGFLHAVTDVRIEQGRYLDTLVLAREAYPDRGAYKLSELAEFYGLPTPTHRALPDAEATAALLIQLGNDLPARVKTYKAAVAASIRSRVNGGDAAAADAALEAAKVESGFSKGLTGLLHKKTVRELVLTEGVRMDGRDVDTIRPISVEVGLLPRAHGSALFTRGDTQALTVATLGPVVRRAAHRHHRSRGVQALPPPLQHAALQHRREQADARPRPARDRAWRARRAGAHPGAADPRGVPVRHPPRERVRDVQRLHLDGLDLRLDAGAHGCRRAHQGARRGCRHGSRDGGRPVRRPDRHPGQGRRLR